MKITRLLAAALTVAASLPPLLAAEAKTAPVVLSIFQVNSDKDEGYRSTQTISGSRTLADLRDTPNSISVLNRELLDDLIAVKLSDAMYFSVTGEIDTNRENANESFVFRGIVANLRLRNGVTWYGGTTDAYAIERVELLRGPHAFLYGEGTAGGLINQLTKQASSRDFQNANLIFGSNELRRVELDVNRRLAPNLAVRTALVYSHEGTQQHHAERDLRGIYVTGNWRPFRHTQINADIEYRRQDGVIGSNMLADGFSVTARTGATTALTATTGGRTYIPALGLSYDTVNRRRSNGTTIVLANEQIMPREFNFLGPDSVQDSKELAFGFHVDQRVGDALSLQASYTYFDIEKSTTERVGSSAGSVYRDTNATLPSGVVNPYFNELYTEYYSRRNNNNQAVHNARLTAVYELKLPFTTQKLVGSAVYHDAEPGDFRFTEFVDPASGNFKGTLSSAQTLAAYTANVNTVAQNFFYRRFYLKDGDRAALTRGGPVPGQSVILRDMQADSATGRLSSRLYRTPAYGIGSDGAYFNGRVHTLLGWRRSSFNQDPSRDFYNPVTGGTYKLDTPLSVVRTRITEDSYTYGAVVHFAKFVGAYYNYAESVSLSSGVGGAQLTPGKLRGPLMGDGQEFGLRWSFLGGRVESNWTYFITNATKNAANPAIPANVRQTELGPIFGGDIDTTGTDIQTTKSTGLEFETTANLTKAWRLTWNFSKNDLATSERYPQLKDFQARAKARSIATPDTDAFLASAPDGTPLPGFTKLRSNLVTMYRFDRGPLKDFSFGGSVQFRDKSYQGNFDLNNDGVAEELWTSGYTLWNVMFGYRTKIRNRRVDLSINVNNLFDKDYFRSFALATGAWGEGRSFRFAARLGL
ncbi:TonB-dependent siderophore receptor [Horticoccus sp. 23ND18S-11]|uniref:TonB-dependent siderophore receptor n=1 Tax=Horticoccus sp. 23ND18S-11 TaxID=3391832 RepID=UPI0039C9DE52